MSSPPQSSRIVPRPHSRSRSQGSTQQAETVAEPTTDMAPEVASSEDSASDDQDQGGGDLPMSMTASVMLTHLPRDASQALKEIEAIDDMKVSVRFHAIGGAPILKQKVFKISASSRFSVVLNFLRKKLGIREGDGLFCYVNSVFAPGLDEGVGNLFRCFKVDDHLIVSYSTTPAFG